MTNNANYKLTVTTASLLMLLSCSVSDDGIPPPEKADKERIAELISNLPPDICIFDPAEFFPAQTRGETSGLPVSIQSGTLDFSLAATLSTERYDYIQIPVTASTPLSGSRVRFPDFLDGQEYSSPIAAKTFLIAQTARDSAQKTTVNIVTIVPHPDYMREEEIDSLDFFYDGFFNAVFFYADLDGKLLKAETFVHGRPYKEGRVSAHSAGDQAIAAIAVVPTGCDSTLQSGVFGAALATPADNWLDEVVVIGYPPDDDRDDWKNEDPDHPSNGHDGDEPDETVNYVENPLYGGGKEDDGITCTVTVNVEGRGIATGGGTYGPFDIVHCSAQPVSYNGTPTSEFIMWNGDILSYEPSVTFSIEAYILRGRVSLTAVFHNIDPCAEGERRDPLMEMSIQASGAGGWNLRGGTFGMTRNNKTKLHQGMDFACPVGTPVFATHAGKVVAIRDDVSPDDKSFTDYKNRGGKDCENDRIFNAGNAIEIECSIGGATYIVKYFHLSEILVKDTWVEAGEIIALSGATGNASGKNSGGPHLHYEVRRGHSYGTLVNPESFIYSRFDKDNSWKLINPCR